MGRAEIRKQVKQGDVIPRSEHVRIVRIYVDEAKREAIKQYSTCIAFVLRDHLGFGIDRSRKFLDKTLEVFKDIQEDRLTVKDISETLAQEIQLIIE